VTDTVEHSLVNAAAEKPPFYRDATVVKWIVQVTTLIVVILAIIFLVGEAGDNLEAKSITTGFDFLSTDLGFNISEGIDTDPDTGGRALWVGMVNTIRMSIAGIGVATLLGILIGISRLSSNWVVAKVASAFIEYMRNIPLLVHIFLLFFVFGSLGNFGEGEPVPGVDPETGEAILLPTQGPINGLLHVSNKGVSIPRVHIADGFYQWAIFLLIGGLAGRWFMRKRKATQDATGQETYPFASFAAVLAVFAIIGWFLHPIFGWVGGAIFSPIESFIRSVPQIAVQLGISAIAIVVAALWIRRFLDSRRTPAGLAKLTDDDWFRMIFAGVSALIASFVVLVIWPGLSSWIINSSGDLFRVAADKFGEGRGDWQTDLPVDVSAPNISKPGNFANPGPAGLNFSQGFSALFFGVVLYTSAFIEGPDRSCPSHWFAPLDHVAPDRSATSISGELAAAWQPVPQPHQEHLARHCCWLQRCRASWPDRIQPNRAIARDLHHLDAVLLSLLADHQRGGQLL